MVQALLTSIRGMLGSQATQTKEFKEEAVKNNRNVSSVLKDLSTMFASSRSASNRQSSTLNSIENISSATSGKVDRTNALLQESISLQNQMLVELKTFSRSITSMMSNNAMSQQQDAGGGGLLQAALGIGTAGLGAAAVGAALDYQKSSLLGNNLTRPGNSDTGGGEKLSVGDMVKLAKEAGFTDEQAKIMGAIGAAESSGNPKAHNPNASTGDNSYGLWQINMLGRMESERKKLFGIQDNEQLKDPKINAMAAKKIFDQQGFEAWSVYKSGAYNKYLGTAQNLRENDETGGVPGSLQMASLTPPNQTMMPQQDAMGNQGGMVYEKQRELAGVRKQPLNPNLVRVLEQAASAAGVDVHIYSGGQAAKGSGGGPRTGSTRHDNGNAADLYLTRGNRKLSDTNTEDREIMAKFVSAAVAAGATGVGAGHGYMGPSNIHVGFGTPATWGGAPWISAAAGGVYSNKDLTSEGSGMGGMGGAGDGGIASTLSMLGMSVGDLSGLISSFFGVDMNQILGGGNSLGEEEIKGLRNFETSEEEPDAVTPKAEDDFRASPSNKFIGDETTKEADSNMIGDKSLQTRLRAIQTAAVEEKTMPPVVLGQSSSADTYYDKAIQRQETPPSFVSGDTASVKETRASWAPRIAVLRPDDNAAKNLTWAARINNLA